MDSVQPEQYIKQNIYLKEITMTEMSILSQTSKAKQEIFPTTARGLNRPFLMYKSGMRKMI